MNANDQTIPAIDVHSHMISPCYLEGLKEQGVDPLKEDGFPTPVEQIQNARADLASEPELQPYLQAILHDNALKLYHL